MPSYVHLLNDDTRCYPQLFGIEFVWWLEFNMKVLHML